MDLTDYGTVGYEGGKPENLTRSATGSDGPYSAFQMIRLIRFPR